MRQVLRGETVPLVISRILMIQGSDIYQSIDIVLV